MCQFQANAIVELRAGYGIQTPGEDAYTTESLAIAGFNLDAIIELPLLPFGFGLRYENMGFDIDNPLLVSEAKMTRIAALINYRFIDFFPALYFLGC